MDKEDRIIELLEAIIKKMDHQKISQNYGNSNSCTKCGLQLTDALGNSYLMGFVCADMHCSCGFGPTIC